MIPKTIHYCWFGGKPLPELAQKCIASWKKFCPNYEIIEWNENNYDISSAPLYVRQAYEAKKWGFVPDYIRLELIYKYGGVYLDTDVEIIKPLDDLLCLEGFAGFENEHYVALGLGFGAEKGNRVIKLLMDSYSNRPFLKGDGSPDITPAPQINLSLFLDLGLIPNGNFQTIGGFTILPKEYLCAKDGFTGEIVITDNTYSIHHYDGSWLPEEMTYIRDMRFKFAKFMPHKIAHWTSLIIGFTKYRGFFKMPKAMIDYKKDNIKKRKRIELKINKHDT